MYLGRTIDFQNCTSAFSRLFCSFSTSFCSSLAFLRLSSFLRRNPRRYSLKRRRTRAEKYELTLECYRLASASNLTTTFFSLPRFWRGFPSRLGLIVEMKNPDNNGNHRLKCGQLDCSKSSFCVVFIKAYSPIFSYYRYSSHQSNWIIHFNR